MLHDVVYYILNSIPQSEHLALSETSHNHARMMNTSSGARSTSSTKTNSNISTSVATSASALLAKRVTKIPSSWTKGPDHTITIGTLPGPKFDAGTIQVKAGSTEILVFNKNDDIPYNRSGKHRVLPWK